MNRAISIVLSTWLAIIVSKVSLARAESVLTEEVLRVSEIVAKLASILHGPGEVPSENLKEFEESVVWYREPDKSVYAKTSTHCYAVHRGTSSAVSDWLQNFTPLSLRVCPAGESSCCSARAGYVRAYQRFADSINDRLLSCLEGDACIKPDGMPGPCQLVLGGHSQGGAAANIHALHLREYDPIVITFGGPGSIRQSCELLNSSNWFRFVNTRWAMQPNEVPFAYDPVPFLFSFGHFAHGHFIGISEDPTGVAYYGIDSGLTLYPWDLTRESHDVDNGKPTEKDGYLQHIQGIIAHYDENEEWPGIVDGFASGSPCIMDLECSLGVCSTGICN